MGYRRLYESGARCQSVASLMSFPMKYLLIGGQTVHPVRGASPSDMWVCEPVRLSKGYEAKEGCVRAVPPVLYRGVSDPKAFHFVSFPKPILDKMRLPAALRLPAELVDEILVYYFGFLVPAFSPRRWRHSV